MRAAVVDLATNIVVNLIVADVAECLPPDGCFLVDVSDIWCDMGALYDAATSAFLDVSPPEPEEPAPVSPEPVI